MTKDVSTISFGANTLIEAHYVGTLFQRCQNLLLYPTLQIHYKTDIPWFNIIVCDGGIFWQKAHINEMRP